MKVSNYKIIYLMAALLITVGCSKRSQVLATDPATDGYQVQQEVDLAISDWQQNHNYDAAVMRLERLSRFSGGGFEESRLTALSLMYWESGNRHAFLETASRLGATINSFEYVDPQSQHVMTVAYAVQGKPSSELPGRGYDIHRVNTIYRLLGATGVNHDR